MGWLEIGSQRTEDGGRTSEITGPLQRIGHLGDPISDSSPQVEAIGTEEITGRGSFRTRREIENQVSGIRDQRSEIRDQISEVGSQKAA